MTSHFVDEITGQFITSCNPTDELWSQTKKLGQFYSFIGDIAYIAALPDECHSLWAAYFILSLSQIPEVAVGQMDATSHRVLTVNLSLVPLPSPPVLR